MDNNQEHLGRRDFLKIMAASLGLAGLTACRPRHLEQILPYSVPPPELTPGEPLFFATAFERGGYGLGILVKSHMGRPVKVEGNPDHPASLGATDVFAQASILDLYDPDRAKVMARQGIVAGSLLFMQEMEQALQAQRLRQGAGLRILTGAVSSPTFISQMETLLSAFPEARWHSYEPLGRENLQAGAELAFGEAVESRFYFDRAQVILSLDSDFLFNEPGAVRYAREFAEGRQVLDGQGEMNRLYVIESSLTITGGQADHRLPLRPAQIEEAARQIAARLGIDGLAPGEGPLRKSWLDAVVADLEAHAGAALILAGPQQPPSVQALVHAINDRLGSVGNTIEYLEPVHGNPEGGLESLADLAAALAAGQVDLLVIFDGNPAYTAPADLNFANRISQAALSVYLGLQVDETAARVHWHIPAAHYLEMWGDTRSYDGTTSIIQPLIEPLYENWSPYELASVLLGQPRRTGYSLVREHWQEQSQAMGIAAPGFENFWGKALHKGLVDGTASDPVQVVIRAGMVEALNANTSATASNLDGFDIVFTPDPTLWDGRFANNAWLQELPKPFTSLTWDNAILLAPSTAERLGLTGEDVVILSLNGRSVEGAVLVTPGQPEDCLGLSLGYGRERGGQTLPEAGFNAYALRLSTGFWFAGDVQIAPTGRRRRLALTQAQTDMEGREPVRHGSLAEFRQDPAFAQRVTDPPPSLYPEYDYDLHAWGMSINLSACTGCNACVVACQAENNVPVVGKEEVLNHREMHWLRIDRYIEREQANPRYLLQPMLCMHCEKAPCEPVCPVNATVHSSEGLNEMVYARCIGVRYCSHNCPYKVRRFNHYEYASEDIVPLKLLHNPEVTVRKRGVIEKCTFCVQRINSARSKAKIENRRIQDGELVTACQQACPTNAIVFGDLNDESSRVRQLKEQPHDYGLLAELGTQPRLTYLARLSNPHEEIES
jgi:Fe-S-cluster-containing dehydrogenase component